MIIFDGILDLVPLYVVCSDVFGQKLADYYYRTNLLAQNKFKYSMLGRARARNPGKIVIFDEIFALVPLVSCIF
jgi:hypothetical protein